MKMRVITAPIVQAKTSGKSEQDLLVSEYTPRRVFPFSKEGPGGVIFCPMRKFALMNLQINGALFLLTVSTSSEVSKGIKPLRQ